MRFKIILILLLCIILIGCIFFSKMQISGSYVWYSEPRGIKLFDNTYIGMVDTKGNIKVLQVNDKTKKFKIINITENYQKNEHAHPVLLLLPDNRIMVIYSKHDKDNFFNYKVSLKPNDLSSLTEEKTAIISDNNKIGFTYPNPFIMQDNPNFFYILYRGENWHPTISKFTLPDKDGNIKLIGKSKQIVQSSGARPYAKYISNGIDKIFIAYTTGHCDNELPNRIYFSVIDTNTLKLFDIKGNYIADLNKAPFKISEITYTVVDNTENSRDCIWDLVFDKNNNPMIAFAKISADKQKHDYYIAKWNGEKWLQNKIADGGSYFHGIKGVEETFSGGMSIDKNNPNIIWISAPKKGLFGKKYEIFKVLIDNNLEVKYIKQFTKNSYYNNIRPYNIKDFSKIIRLSGKYDYWQTDETHIGFPLKVKIRNKL
ncbi:BNR-4 repeat-containing protein [bacterium]|nr:BNR-4 repeat-containing protein [bacterium]